MARAREVPDLDCDEPFARAAARVVEVRAAEVFEQAPGVLDLGDVERLADRVAILDRGRIVAEGPPAELAAGAEPRVRVLVDRGLSAAELQDLAAALDAVAPGAVPARDAGDATGAYRVDGAAPDPVLVAAADRDKLLVAGALTCERDAPDAIDAAILGGLSDESALAGFEVLHLEPFDPVRKRAEAEVRADGATFHVAKGAPQVILALAANATEVTPGVDEAVNGFAKRGFRSLGVARTDGGDRWRFVGVLPLFDPPREDSKATLATAREMGVNVKMVTGDQVAIGRETARELGLGTNILDAGALDGTRDGPTMRVTDAIEQADGFAQVFPEHKFRIVDALQRRNHIVGMTGDGVNDAPALKKADCGIAVSGATDAARAAADIVLTSPGLSVIIDAIKESRKAFQRMNSYAIYRITETIRVLLFMTLSILVFNFYPVTAVMIGLLALLNEGPILPIALDTVHHGHPPAAKRR